jgi:hypothetical protein
MGRETIPFHERKQFTWAAYFAAMRNDLERAGLSGQLPDSIRSGTSGATGLLA